jgi:phage terminase small subunit
MVPHAQIKSPYSNGIQQMAGVKGKSGGPRKNAGGARSGAGRKPKAKIPPPPPVQIEERSMLELLQDVALGRVEATALQVRAAIAAVQYTHAKKGEGGKKDEVADKAKKAGSGKFKSAPAPLKLVQR